MDNQIIWLLLGCLLIIGEFFVLPGTGLVFAGLGALVTGLLLEIGIVHEVLDQWLVFFVASIGSAAILWKPLKNFRQNKGGKQYSNMVGDKAVLETPLEPGGEGKAKWSGTVMKARLDDSLKKTLAKGKTVEIIRVEGNVLVVK